MQPVIYKRKWPLIVFFAPSLLFLAVFLFYPFAVNIYNSFFEIPRLGAPAGAFNHFDNYGRLLSDPKMSEAYRNTAAIMVMGVVFQVGGALLFAILVDSVARGAKVYRTVFFFPVVISATAIGLMFALIYQRNGALNQLIQLFGGEGRTIWLNPPLAFFMLAIPVLWQYVGFYFVIILTGLNNIGEEIMEAAKIDGACGFQRVRYITLPMLYNVLITCLTLSVTGSLKVFDMPWQILPNGVSGTFLTSTYMYFVTYQKQNVDYACAIAIAIVVIGVAIAGLLNTAFKPKEL